MLCKIIELDCLDCEFMQFIMLQEVCALRKQYELRIQAAESETNEYVAALNAATNEVLTFHKFYQGLDTENNNATSSMYFTDLQFQELVETEHMLELYSKFYNKQNDDF